MGRRRRSVQARKGIIRGRRINAASWFHHLTTAPNPAGQNPKHRAFVIISDCTGLKAGQTVAAVAVTSTFREPVGTELVPMRWNARGTTETKFKRKYFAKADWLLQVDIIAAADGSAVFDGQHDGAYVRDKELRLIAEAITRVRAQ